MDPGDADREQLEDRVAELEQTVSKMLPDRRGVLKGLGAAAVGGAAVGGATGGASGQSAAGQIGTESEPVDVEGAQGNFDSVNTGRVSNDILWAESWGELVTLYQNASEGQEVRVDPSVGTVTATSTLSITNEGVDVRPGVTISPDSDTRTIFEIPESFKWERPHIEATIVVSSTTYSGPAVVADPASSNYGKTPSVDLGLYNTDGAGELARSGTAFRAGAGDLGGNHITGLYGEIDIIGFDKGLDVDGGTDTGEYANGNRFEGQIWGCSTCIETAGATDGNRFYYQVQPDNTDYVVRFNSRNYFSGRIFDSGTVNTASVEFKSDAENSVVSTSRALPQTATANAANNYLHDQQNGIWYRTDEWGNFNLDGQGVTASTQITADNTFQQLINHRQAGNGAKNIGGMTGIMTVHGYVDGDLNTNFVDLVLLSVRGGVHNVISTATANAPATPSYQFDGNSSEIAIDDPGTTYNIVAQKHGGAFV